ncbi:hypothetical protein EXIGLDRAFT_719520 [Exidia glandulosa HHB12029]|uniref:Uncharacterized protein n=1 Tax=Exidia glandulosa HHB12029 TaxID=1314781 RepID=A0A165NS91_EXIGL|nr:hypothetical protein EXIGLDRAFT_719520 [Exidia glandulosa HHB12029]
MSTQEFSSEFIQALEPTALHDREHFRLRDTDLYLPFPVDAAIIVPGAVDAERLKAALVRALSIFPLYGGRIEKRDGHWIVRLVNTNGALFDVVDSNEEKPPVAPNSPVILSPFNLSKRNDHWSLYSGSSDEPLLRLTLIRGAQGRWSAVVFWMSHVIGDGEGVRAFMRTVSRYYEGLEPLDEDVPCYDYPAMDVLPAEELQKVVQPWLTHTAPLPSQGPTTATVGSLTATPPSLRVVLRLTAEQLAQLRSGVLAQGPDEALASDERISTQDCIVAAVASAISKTYEAQGLPGVTRIDTIVNYRGVGPVPRTAANNALIQAVADTNFDSILTTALAVRRSLLRCRSYTFATGCIALHAFKLAAAANSVPPRSLDFSPGPQSMTVNSTRPFDWTGAHFGFAGKASFYHTMSNKPRFVKIFTPNPTLLADGQWRENRGGAEVVFHLEAELRETFPGIFRGVVAQLGVKEEIEFANPRA